MRTYEAVVIFPLQPTGEAHPGSKNTFEEVVKKHEGKVLSRLELGRRMLGYSVKKSREGYIASFDFELDPAKINPLKRALDLADDVLKYTIVIKQKTTKFAKKTKAPKPPAVPAGERR